MENKAKHVAIIMDGNGRWAVNRGKKRTEGHKKGAEALREISECIYDKGVEVLSVYAFSTENWKRDKEEVDYLMDLFIKAFKENFEAVKKKGIKVIFSGLRTKLSDKVLNAISEVNSLDIDYIILNSFSIPNDIFKDVTHMFKNVNDSNKEEYKEKIDSMLDTYLGFLYKETIYKVKKND